MTPSAEAWNLARRIRNELGGEPFLTEREAAQDIDALCAQRISAERERLVNACSWAIHDIDLPPGENNSQIRGMITCAVADAIRASKE